MAERCYHPNQIKALENIKNIESALDKLIEELKQHPEFDPHAFYVAQNEFTTGVMWLKRGVDKFS